MIPQETETNLVFLGVGMLIGLVLGWSLKGMRYSRQVRDKLDERSEGGWYTHRISLFIVLGLTVAAAVSTTVVNAQFQKSKDCTEVTFTKVIKVLNERTSLNSDVNSADRAQNTAFAIFLQGLLKDPPMSEAGKKELFTDYLKKLESYNDLVGERDASTDYPTVSDYRNCLEG